MRVVAFEPWHLHALDLQPIQATGDGELDVDAYAASSSAWTIIGDERLPIACAGFLPAAWPGQALAWAMLGDTIGRHHLAFTRRIAREFDRSGFHRIEALVQSAHAAGHRWCRLLGMTHEGTMRRWGPQAIDHDVYAKVRGI